MKRRTFIKTTAALGIAMDLGPEVLSGSHTILGHGNKRYRINTQWSQADAAKYPVNDCHEMVQDQKGRLLLLTNETKNNLLIYDKSGRILDSWGTEYPGAHGLTIHNENGEDMLYISDYARHQVIKTTIDGRVLMVLDCPREGGLYASQDEFLPTETAIGPTGDIYVADGYGKDYILRYDASGRFLGSFGGRGQSDAHLLNAHGIALDLRDPNKPCLLVTSRQQNAFKRFDLDGNYLSTIPVPGAWVCRPVIKGDYVYSAVLQTEDRQGEASGFITILDKDNRVVSNPAGSDPGTGALHQTVRAFQYPHDVCIDNDENLYIPQWNSGKTYPIKLEPVA